MTSSGNSPNCPTLRGTNKNIPVTFSPENTTLQRERQGVEIEGFPKGGKRRGHRVPRTVLQSGNRFDIDAGRRGMFKCPYLSHYCSKGSAVDVRKCKGFDDCHVRLKNQLIARMWERINDSKN